MTRAWSVPDLDAKAPFSTNARKILAVRTAELFSYDAIIPDPAAVSELHNARIASKRLRYTLELFASVFGEEGEEAIDEVKQLQEDLGLIHDHDVLIARIEDDRDALKDDTDQQHVITSLGFLLDREKLARVDLHAGIVNTWNSLGNLRLRLDQLAASA